jgi:hypothetical protein
MLLKQNMSQVKTYQNPHHFNPFFMRHHYYPDGTVRRSWTKKEEVYHYPCAQEVSSLNLEKTYPLDGGCSLEELVDDIHRCFCFTATGGVMTTNGKWSYYDDVEIEQLKPEIDMEMFSTIYETKLPPNTKVYVYRTGTVCQGVVEMLAESDLVESNPCTYYDLFEIIGIECEYFPPQKAGRYTVWQYPDSVILTLEAKDDKIFFGYGR